MNERMRRLDVRRIEVGGNIKGNPEIWWGKGELTISGD